MTFRVIDSIITKKIFTKKRRENMKKQRIFTKKHFAPLLILVAAFLLLAAPKVNASAASKKPGAVIGFTAKSDHDDGGIKLKWKKVRHAKYYEIYWKKSKKGKFEYWRTSYTPDYNLGIDSYFQLGKTYYFKVRAVNGKKKGKFSPVKSAKAVLGKPFLGNLSLKSENSVSMEINGYSYSTELYRATSKNGKYSKIKTFKKNHSPDDYSYIDANLLPGEYFYKARSYKKIKGKKIYSKFSPIRSIIVPKKVEITMDNWMQYYEVSPCNSDIYYNAFGEIECLYHQHTLQLKNNYILHDSHYKIAESSIAVEAEYTVQKQEAIIDWQSGTVTPGAIVSDEYTYTKMGSISRYNDFRFIDDYLSKSDSSPTINTTKNVTMKRIQGTIYLDKW